MLQDLTPRTLKIVLAVTAAVAVLMVLIPRREPLFRVKAIGFGWTPNDWQGWVLLLALVVAVAAGVVLFRLTRGG